MLFSFSLLKWIQRVVDHVCHLYAMRDSCYSYIVHAIGVDDSIRVESTCSFSRLHLCRLFNFTGSISFFLSFSVSRNISWVHLVITLCFCDTHAWCFYSHFQVYECICCALCVNGLPLVYKMKGYSQVTFISTMNSEPLSTMNLSSSSSLSNVRWCWTQCELLEVAMNTIRLRASWVAVKSVSDKGKKRKTETMRKKEERNIYREIIFHPLFISRNVREVK